MKSECVSRSRIDWKLCYTTSRSWTFWCKWKLDRWKNHKYILPLEARFMHMMVEFKRHDGYEGLILGLVSS